MVVIVMVGIVAAIALPRLSRSGFEERGLRDQIVAALRYAQKSAIAARQMVCVTFSPGRIDFNISTAAYPAANCSAGTALVGPDGTVLSVVPTGSTSFSAAQPMLIFDAAGRPGAGTSVVVNGLPARLAITVESETGYVH
ncbi:hypothetical protein LZ012_07125 [Dechloromonas sp. XY25]|uniref:Uncharacterized protein n=1 Tax=Dechloromonas hankyongensis TaxID=2908002 RepID=A0ABS9K0R2_9RHOO|nr:hypothetical protein [Dechloromonas hankyongensis]